MFLAYLRFVVRKLEIISCKSNKIIVLLNNVFQHIINVRYLYDLDNKRVNCLVRVVLFTRLLPFVKELPVGKS